MVKVPLYSGGVAPLITTCWPADTPVGTVVVTVTILPAPLVTFAEVEVFGGSGQATLNLKLVVVGTAVTVNRPFYELFVDVLQAGNPVPS